VEYRLLGDVEIRDDSGSVVVMSARQLMVLAVLLYRINTVVPRQELIRLVWGPRAEDRPLTAERLVTDYVSRLRMVVSRPGRTGELRLVARSPGFVARGDSVAVDWHRFRGLVAEARAARESDMAPQARQLLHTALQLWRGPALADLPADSLRPLRTRMTALRLMAARESAMLALAADDPASMIEELDDLCAAHPEEEMLAVLLIQSLHRSGRRDAAVIAYRRCRDYLADALGLDPSSELHRAYRSLLVPPAVGLLDVSTPGGR
jgi:DNA-binding SARP family transcriptional activator